ncbi:phosphoribosylglycinamide synthetase C domain-containing protein [Exiguobacterium aurantiacum]|uniref:phosphoribosylglycinamide synthetase C domain-containing protein n=1 Tax=Exiguobacterium aurantiacum TaxID=33987 RepID=UPI000B26784A|nr:phosphoribosylglycinamide synthetase C domain-containing protein [Exiguobacterium aurantiacum]
MLGNGGRLFVITSTKPTLLEAKQTVYAALETLELPNTFYRTDIAGRALAHIF